MANPTTNFGWQMPTATDLVTDLPADFEVFGQAVDTALLDLKGGTTGQVLAKASGTDLDFVFVDVDDTNAIQNSIIAAKGDIVIGTANDTPSVLTAGTNETRLVADSGEATGLKYVADTTNYAIAAKGDLLVGTAADTLAPLTVGTNGDILVADSTETTGLKWVTPTGGGQTLISTTTLSTGTTTISATLTSYEHIFIVLKMVQASTDTNIRMRLSGDTGSNYNINRVLSQGSSASGQSTINASAFLLDAIGTSANVRAAFQGTINVWRVNDTNEHLVETRLRQADGSDYGNSLGVGVHDSSAVVSSITFFLDAGTFSAGTVYLYGVK
jgi:hypothetical protein